MQRKKVLSFGELLLRISFQSEAWLQDHQFRSYIGGAESNVAFALALWGIPSAYMSAVPDNGMTRQILHHMEEKGIDTSRMIFSGSRLGLYYLESGKDLKNSSVIYDRQYSSFAALSRADIDWDQVFEDVSWFHFSAICPALNQNIADICEDAVKAAAAKGIFVSLDLNYRAKLWKYGKRPSEVLPAMAKYCNLIMGNVWAAHQMLDIPLAEPLQKVQPHYPNELLITQADASSREMMTRYPECRYVANTFRFDSDGTVTYFSTISDQVSMTVSDTLTRDNVTDKVGSGDCFMAGLIYGFYHDYAVQDVLNFATAAAVSKLNIPSDATTVTVKEIMNVLEKNKNYDTSGNH